MAKLNWLTTGLISSVIIILSTIPVPEVPELQDVPFFDKWMHFLMYGALTFAMWFDWWYVKRWKKPSSIFVVMSVVYPSLLGGLMEIVQATCTDCRSGDVVDFYADVFGAVLGVLIMLAVWKMANKSKHSVK